MRFGHLWIDALGFSDALGEIEALVLSGGGGSVFTPNVDHVVTAEDDEDFRAAYGEASLCLADGQPLIWSSRMLGARLPSKISGSDLVWPLMELAARRRWRVYLLGGAPGVANAAAARLERELGVRIAGVDAPVIDLDAPGGEADAAVERLRATRPDLVLVALGAPKQERWIHRALPRIRPAVAIAVGASLDFLAGRVRRAPRWMARVGLEWLFRLAQEPRRLARRYLLKDPRFLLILARTALAPRSQRVRERALPEWVDSTGMDVLMGKSRRESLAASTGFRELQEMWLALLRASWSSIVVVPTDPGTSGKVVTGALVAAAGLDDAGRFEIIDAEGATSAQGERLAQDLASVVARGARAVVAVDSLMQSLGGVPLVRDVDAALLVVRFGVSSFDSVQSTIDIVGRERILGAVALPS